MTNSIQQIIEREAAECPSPLAEQAFISGANFALGLDRWVSTSERLPEKPGKLSYEHVRCLVIKKGYIQILMWNCEHLCWDGEDGDDYDCDPLDVSFWQPLPSPPSPQ